MRMWGYVKSKEDIISRLRSQQLLSETHQCDHNGRVKVLVLKRSLSELSKGGGAQFSLRSGQPG